MLRNYEHESIAKIGGPGTSYSCSTGFLIVVWGLGFGISGLGFRASG